MANSVPRGIGTEYGISRTKRSAACYDVSVREVISCAEMKDPATKKVEPPLQTVAIYVSLRGSPSLFHFAALRLKRRRWRRDL